MVTYEDCIALCGLTAEEVQAIAEHEHVPEIAAAALGNYLLNQEHGPEQIRRMIIEDIQNAVARGDQEHARRLVMALRHFCSTYAEALRPQADRVT
jgi:hypothetical protein